MNKIKRLVWGDGKNQLRKNIIWNMVGSLIFALASILLFAAATRATDEYYGGIFSIAFTTGQLLLTIGYYEIRPFHVTDITNQYSFSDYLSARAVTSAVMLAGGFIYTAVSGAEGTKAAVLILMCVYKMMDGIADVFEGEFQRKGHLDMAGKSMAFRTVFSGGIFIAAVFLTHDIVAASLAAVVAAVAAFAVFDLIFIREVEQIRFSADWKKIGRLLKDCFWLFVGSFLFLYICNASKYAIDRHMSEEFVTYYTDIYIPTSAINLVCGFVFKPMLTVMAESCEQKRWRDFSRMVNRMMAGVAGVTAAGCLGAWLLGIPVLSFLFGHDLRPYRAALTVLILGGGFNAASMLLYYALTTMRKQQSIVICYGIAFVASVAASPALVSRFGITGGAVAYTASLGVLVLVFLIATICCYRRQKEDGYQ